jgi:DNA polymerase-4
MGHETTLSQDEGDLHRLESYLVLLCDKLSRRLRREDYSGHVVTLKIKWSDRSLITRQKALPFPTDEERVIFTHARELLRRNVKGRRVRMIGVSVGHLLARRNQVPLFFEDLKYRSYLAAKDRIRDRFGESVLMPARMLTLIGNVREWRD